MTENKSNEPNYYETMIDLRSLIKTIWKGKWIILAGIVLAVIAAFLVDTFFLSATYESSAQIGIRRETFYADFEPSIENPSGLEDYRNLSDLTKSLPQMAEAEDILLSVCDEIGIVCVGEESERPDIKSSLLGTNQLRLTASCEYPERCAEFANLWAEEVINRWNILYGNEAIDLNQLGEEVDDARDNWEESQVALEAYLPTSKVNVVQVQLNQAKQELSLALLEIEDNNRIIRDADALDARLASLAQDSAFSLGDALSLIALQQRSTGGISGTQFQMPEGAILGMGYSVADARKNVFYLTSSLMEQNQELEETLSYLENNINSLALDFEKENYQVDQLTQERDRAKEAYQALARHLDEVTLNLRYQGKSAYLLAQARIPEEESGSSTVLVVLASAFVAGVIAVGGVLVFDWWREE